MLPQNRAGNRLPKDLPVAQGSWELSEYKAQGAGIRLTNFPNKKRHGGAAPWSYRPAAVSSLVQPSVGTQEVENREHPVPTAAPHCQASLSHAIFYYYYYCWDADELVLSGLCTIFYFAKLHFLFQKPYFDVNLVNRGLVRSNAEHKSSSKEVDQKSAVGLMKDRLTIRLGRTAWIGGKDRFKGLVIAWEHMEGEMQNSEKGCEGGWTFLHFAALNALDVKSPLLRLIQNGCADAKCRGR